jgi:hypothetical protein
VPAAAVIPAPIAYIEIVAVKKLVVGSEVGVVGSACAVTVRALPYTVIRHSMVLFTECYRVHGTFTLKKLKCSKQALVLVYSCME